MPGPFQRICLLATVLAVLIGSGSVCFAGRNTVLAIELQQLDRMLATDPSPRAIIFMAAWCMPCIEELPAVNAMYDKYGARGLRMLGLSLDLGGPQAIQPFVDQHKVQFPVYWVGEEAIKAYRIRGIPLILLVKDGKITERIVGKRSKKELDRIFGKFLQ